MPYEDLTVIFNLTNATGVIKKEDDLLAKGEICIFLFFLICVPYFRYVLLSCSV